MLSNNTEVALEAWDQEHQEMNLLDCFNGILIQPLDSTREICWGTFCHLNRHVLHFCNLDSTILSPSIRTSFSNYSVDPNSYSFQNILSSDFQTLELLFFHVISVIVQLNVCYARPVLCTAKNLAYIFLLSVFYILAICLSFQVPF